MTWLGALPLLAVLCASWFWLVSRSTPMPDPFVPQARPEARERHPVRLPLLRAGSVFVLLTPLAGVAVYQAWLGPGAALGAALALAAGVAPIAWAERRLADRPADAQWMVLLLGTAAGVLALLNVAALRGGATATGVGAWVELVGPLLESPGDALSAAIAWSVPAAFLWGLPCVVVTDVRVRAGARLLAPLPIVAGVLVLPVGLTVLGLELAYRLAARCERRLGAEDPR